MDTFRSLLQRSALMRFASRGLVFVPVAYLLFVIALKMEGWMTTMSVAADYAIVVGLIAFEAGLIVAISVLFRRVR